jgi:hypothetical protein
MVDSTKFARVVLCVLFIASTAAAQETVSPLPGTLLRVTAPTVAPDPLVGTLVEATERELVLAIPGSDRRTVPRAAVTRLEWSRGRHGNPVRGMIWGTVIGAVALSAINARDPETGRAQEHVFVAFVGAGMGALPGAVIGALIKTQRWAEVPVSNVRVLLAPLKGSGLAMGFTLTW